MPSSKQLSKNALGSSIIVTELSGDKAGEYPPYALSYLLGDQKDIASYKELRLVKEHKKDALLAQGHKYIYEKVCLLDMAGIDVEVTGVGVKASSVTYVLTIDEQIKLLIESKGK
jgi:hypothetical protein